MTPAIAITPPDYSLTTFDYVTIEKEKLLSKLRENRSNHNAIYEAAVSGYWIEAKRTLDEKREDYADALKETQVAFDQQIGVMAAAVEEKRLKDLGNLQVGFAFNTRWNLTFPENHLEDYDRVITMLEMSVADKAQLSMTQFDQYVRNNWSWLRGFADTSKAYVASAVGVGNGTTSAYLSNFIAVSGGSMSLLNG